MATFGKAIGNGYPIAAVVGKKDVMRAVESSFVSSSYWSEPASMAAAIAIQKILRRDKVIARVWDLGKRYQEGIRKIARDFGLPLAVKGRPPVFSAGFELPNPAPFQTLFTQEMAKRGVHAMSGVYIMAAHTPEIIDEVLRRYGEVAPILKQAVQRGSAEGLLEVPVAKPLFRRRLV